MLFKSNFVEENTTKGTVYIIRFKRKVYVRKFNDQLTKIKQKITNTVYGQLKQKIHKGINVFVIHYMDISVTL